MGRTVGTHGVDDRAHVVVVDADQREAGVLAWLLRESGYHASVLSAAAELPQFLHDTPADVVLLRLASSGQDSADAERALRALRTPASDDAPRAGWSGANIPVIVAGIADETQARHALRWGADDWLASPLSAADVVARIGARMHARADTRSLRDVLQRKDDELQRAQVDMATTRQLVEILNEVAAELTAAEIYRVLARRVARALDLRHCSVVLAAPGESVGTVVAAYDDPTITNLQVQIERYPELVAALRTGRAVLVPDVLADPMFADTRALWAREGRTPPIRSVLAIPFGLDRRQSGLFFLRTERGDRTLTSEDSEFAEIVIRAAVAAIRRAHALESTRADNRRLEELATTDALTRLINRRALLERLSVEVDRARRFHSQISLLMLDLDHFKSINDVRGHLAGDEILRQMGTLLAGLVRTIDIVARYGGEEFVLILPETATDGAVVFAERLRERVAQEAFELDGARDFHLTCSIGVATFPSPRVASTEDLFARADEALYRAKSGGRNQVCT